MAITNIKKDATGLVDMKERNKEYEVQSGTSSKFVALTALDSTEDAKIYTATVGAYGASFEVSDRDDKYLLLVLNEAETAAKVFVKAGDNPSWGAGSDLEINIPAGVGSTTKMADAKGLVAVTIDSAQYAQWKAENDWKKRIVIVGAATTTKVCLVKLP